MLFDTLLRINSSNIVEIFNEEEKFLNLINKKNKKFDLLFLDIQLSNSNSIDLLKKEKNSFKNVENIIIISSFCSPQLVQEVFNLGVKGYLTKNCSKKEIELAIKTILTGEKFICEYTKGVISKTFLTDDCKFPQLTPRESEVLKLMCNSLTSKEIALELNLSINTVQMYIKSLFNKFNLNRTTDLIIYAIKNGLNL
jgi:DNA-binding NarL/FixJ family response regulator